VNSDSTQTPKKERIPGAAKKDLSSSKGRFVEGPIRLREGKKALKEVKFESRSKGRGGEAADSLNHAKRAEGLKRQMPKRGSANDPHERQFKGRKGWGKKETEQQPCRVEEGH